MMPGELLIRLRERHDLTFPIQLTREHALVGDPFASKPFGTASDGWPVRLITGFKLVRESSGHAVNITASTVLIAFATSCMIAARRLLACR